MSRFRPPLHGLSMQTGPGLTLEGKHPVVIEIKHAQRETDGVQSPSLWSEEGASAQLTSEGLAQSSAWGNPRG